MTAMGSILVADDEAAFARLACDTLRAQGYHCDWTGSAGEAAGMLCRRGYDLLIAEVCLPGNASLEFVRRLVQLAPEMPVILWAREPTLETAVTAVELSVAAYLAKPVDFDNVLCTVRKCIARAALHRKATEARDELAAWRRMMHETDALLHAGEASNSAEAVRACVTVNLKHVADAMATFGRMIEATCCEEDAKDGWEPIAAAHLDMAYHALVETVVALKETKQFVKSRRLALLRRKLQLLIEQWPRRPGDTLNLTG